MQIVITQAADGRWKAESDCGRWRLVRPAIPALPYLLDLSSRPDLAEWGLYATRDQVAGMVMDWKCGSVFSPVRAAAHLN